MNHEAAIKRAFDSVVDTMFKQVVIKYQPAMEMQKLNKTSKIIRI